MSQPEITWGKVTRQFPCPICKKSDWCGYSGDGVYAVCMRVQSDRPSKNGGHVHRILDDRPLPPPMLPPEKPAPAIDAGAKMAEWRAATTTSHFQRASALLGITVEAWTALGAAYAPEHSAWALPMFDDRSAGPIKAVGIRLRNDTGEKWAVRGSRSGFFFPFNEKREGRSLDRILIVEGPTDTAAALDLGMFAIGRASCRGGVEQIMGALAQIQPKEVVIVHDNDGPGVEGATILADKIASKHRVCRFVPPTKDLRSFLRAGGTKTALESMLKGCVREVPA